MRTIVEQIANEKRGVLWIISLFSRVGFGLGAGAGAVASPHYASKAYKDARQRGQTTTEAVANAATTAVDTVVLGAGIGFFMGGATVTVPVALWCINESNDNKPAP